MAATKEQVLIDMLKSNLTGMLDQIAERTALLDAEREAHAATKKELDALKEKAPKPKAV